MFVEIISNLIRLLHLFFILFILGGWYTNSILTLILYVASVMTLHSHWVLNDDTCAMTILEQKLRGKQCKDETFFGQLVGPVYKMDNEKYNQYSYLVTSTLVVIVIYKLFNNSKTFIILNSFKTGLRNGIDKLQELG